MVRGTRMQMGDYARFELEHARHGERHEKEEYQREKRDVKTSDNGDGDTDMSLAT